MIGHLHCFKEGTLVETEEGLKPIEEIEVGDKVLSYDEETGEQGYKEVVRLFRNETLAWCHVYIDGEKEPIISTPGHKYYLPENRIKRNPNEKLEHAGYEGLNEKWVSAFDLEKGDKVLLSDGRYGIVKKVRTQKLKKAETTYNFEVEDFHTYYVGESGVCVHNAGGPCGGRQFKLANRGQSSTGRRIPNNLNEQIAMQQTISNPLAGETLSIKMNDARWLGTDGWVKMQQVYQFSNGSKVTIHYVLNDALSLIDDFKFVFP